MYIILGLLVFGLLIFVHELGHFVVAKKMGVQVNEFAICMGPVLFEKTVGETRYTLRAIPFGGFCAMEGENENNGNPRAFTAIAPWKRVLILVAGAFMNFVAGLVIMFCLLAGNDYTVLPTIESFQDGAVIAEAGGLEVGDTLYEIDGERIYVYDNVGLLMSRNTTGIFDLVVVRDGEKVTLNDFTMEKQTFLIDGVETLLYGMTFTATENTVGQSLRDSWYSCIDFARLVRFGLSDLVTGLVGVEDMSGPVGIVTTISDVGTSAETTALGIYRVLYLAAFIAVNLAVVNLLPLPALDGGRIFALVITEVVQKLTKRKVDPKYEGYLHTGGMVLLFGFMIYVTFFDVFKVISRWIA